MKVKVFIETKYCEEVLEVDDNATEEEIQEEVNTFLLENLSYGYHILPKDDENEKK